MELIQQEYKFYTPFTGKISTFTETTDMIIPDSFPDFDETIFSCASINVKDELKQPGRILISGQIDAVVLYRSFSEKNPYHLNIPLSFAYVEETKGLTDQAIHFIQYDVTQVDVRIINSRKISVTCTCSIVPQAMEPSYNTVTRDIEIGDSQTQIRSQRKTLQMITAAESTRFVILDDIEASSSETGALLHASIEFQNTDCTVSNGRILLNGSVRLHIWELNNTSVIVCRMHTVPFHQVLEANTLNNNVPTQVRLSCHSMICHYSNSEILSVNFNTEALFWQEAEQTIEWIEDLYDPEKDLRTVFHSLPAFSTASTFPFTSSAEEIITVPWEISSILSAETKIISILPSSGKELKAIAAFSMLCADENLDLHHMQKQQTVSFLPDDMEQLGELIDFKCICETSVQNKQVVLQIRLSGSFIILHSECINNLEEITTVSDINKSDFPVKLLFIRESSPLWKIAKDNRSTVSKIKECNALPQNAEEISNMTILVP